MFDLLIFQNKIHDLQGLLKFKRSSGTTVSLQLNYFCSRAWVLAFLLFFKCVSTRLLLLWGCLWPSHFLPTTHSHSPALTTPFPLGRKLTVQAEDTDSQDVYVQSLLLYEIDQNGTILVNFTHSRWKHEKRSYVKVCHCSSPVACRTDWKVDLIWKRNHTYTHAHTQALLECISGQTCYNLLPFTSNTVRYTVCPTVGYNFIDKTLMTL